MCGIVGYVGKTGNAQKFVIDGLESLEYRGYDSAGIVLLNESAHLYKQVGRVESLKSLLPGNKSSYTAAIGHTRWATHGVPSTDNAHPHSNKDNTIFVVHNGIVENYEELKSFLISKGYRFASQTDSEVIPHLIDWHLKTKKSFNLAFREAIKELRGAYAIAAVYSLDTENIYLAKLSSPLVIGKGDNTHFIASDANALLAKTKKVIYLDDFETAVVSATSVKIFDQQKAIEVQRQHEVLQHDSQLTELGEYDHFMIKEIHEAPQTIQSAIRGRVRSESSTVKLGGLDTVIDQLRFIDRIVIVACGTSYYAGLVGEYLIEEIAGIPVEVQLASEFKYRKEPFSRSTALLAISQSGETADTIAALKKVESFGVLTLGIVNAVGSTIARMTDAGVYCHAGPELSVASTKAFIAQVTILTEIALHLSDGNTKLYKPLLKSLEELPDLAKKVLDQEESIKTLAKKYADNRDFLFIGRAHNYPSALEGALKLKEVSYIHAEGYAAGELKHGPLALIDKQFPSFVIATNSKLLDKTMSSIEEIKARSGPIIALATKGNTKIKRLADDVIYLPDTLEPLQPLLVAIATQLFAYHVATHKGLDVDKPRNLAKSVTVE